MDDPDKLKSLSAKKAAELLEVSEYRSNVLEHSNTKLKNELFEAERKFKELKADFDYNLKVLSDRDQELSNYASTFGSYKDQMMDHNELLSESKIRATELQAQLDAEIARREALLQQSHEEKQALQKKLATAELSATKDIITAENKAAREQDQLRSQLEALQNAHAAAIAELEREKAKDLRIQGEVHRRVLEENAREKRDLERSIHAQQAQIAVLEQDKLELSQEVVSLDTTRNELVRKVSMLEHEKHSTELNLSRLSNEIDEFEVLKESMVETYTKNVEALRGQMTKLEEQHRLEISRVQEEKIGTEQRLQERYTRQEESLTNKVNALEDELNMQIQNARQSTMELESALHDRSDELLQLETKISQFPIEAEKQKRNLENMVWKTERKVNLLQDKNNTLEKKLDLTMSELAQEKQRARTLDNVTHEQERRLHDLSAQLERSLIQKEHHDMTSTHEQSLSDSRMLQVEATARMLARDKTALESELVHMKIRFGLLSQDHGEAAIAAINESGAELSQTLNASDPNMIWRYNENHRESTISSSPALQPGQDTTTLVSPHSDAPQEAKASSSEISSQQPMMHIQSTGQLPSGQQPQQQQQGVAMATYPVHTHDVGQLQKQGQAVPVGHHTVAAMNVQSNNHHGGRDISQVPSQQDLSQSNASIQQHAPSQQQQQQQQVERAETQAQSAFTPVGNQQQQPLSNETHSNILSTSAYVQEAKYGNMQNESVMNVAPTANSSQYNKTAVDPSSSTGPYAVPQQSVQQGHGWTENGHASTGAQHGQWQQSPTALMEEYNQHQSDPKSRGDVPPRAETAFQQHQRQQQQALRQQQDHVHEENHSSGASTPVDQNARRQQAFSPAFSEDMGPVSIASIPNTPSASGDYTGGFGGLRDSFERTPKGPSNGVQGPNHTQQQAAQMQQRTNVGGEPSFEARLGGIQEGNEQHGRSRSGSRSADSSYSQYSHSHSRSPSRDSRLDNSFDVLEKDMLYWKEKAENLDSQNQRIRKVVSEMRKEMELIQTINAKRVNEKKGGAASELVVHLQSEVHFLKQHNHLLIAQLESLQKSTNMTSSTQEELSFLRAYVQQLNEKIAKTKLKLVYAQQKLHRHSKKSGSGDHDGAADGDVAASWETKGWRAAANETSEDDEDIRAELKAARIKLAKYKDTAHNGGGSSAAERKHGGITKGKLKAILLNNRALQEQLDSTKHNLAKVQHERERLENVSNMLRGDLQKLRYQYTTTTTQRYMQQQERSDPLEHKYHDEITTEPSETEEQSSSETVSARDEAGMAKLIAQNALLAKKLKKLKAQQTAVGNVATSTIAALEARPVFALEPEEVAPVAELEPDLTVKGGPVPVSSNKSLPSARGSKQMDKLRANKPPTVPKPKPKQPKKMKVKVVTKGKIRNYALGPEAHE